MSDQQRTVRPVVILTDDHEECNRLIKRAEARAAKWKAAAEQGAHAVEAHMNAGCDVCEVTWDAYNDALVAEDADEGSGT